MLHPCVGCKDEVRRQKCSDGRGPDRCKMQFLRKPVPTEDPQAQESALKKEGEQTFHCQRCTENVSNKATIGGPVHTELEFLNNSCDYPDGEVDEEEFSEKLGCTQVLQVAGPVPGRLQPCDIKAHPDCDRNEQEVIHGGDGELPPRQIKGLHLPLLIR